MKDAGNQNYSMKTDLSTEHPVTQWLRATNPFWMTLYTATSAFALYTCVYAFRKTFPAATFEGISYGGVSYKVWLVIFQAVGYGMSKFIGIRVISELQAHKRKNGILILVAIAGTSWLLFGLVPAPYNIIFLFTNGLPLGMVWGMVFSYLEGRKVTEVLGAALSVSFIFSAGFCRSVGSFLIHKGNISETWMPFIASCLFILPLLTFLWMLDKVPPPTKEDERLRTRRAPMSGTERKEFIRMFLPGIILFVLAYVLLTTFRDFRDNFSAEVWTSLGYGQSPEVYTHTEIPISFLVLVTMGLIMLVKNNHYALMINHLIIATGMLMIGIATFLFQRQFISPSAWMIFIGLGLYLGYVPFNSIFFDRLIATFRFTGTVGFIMYVADSFGYLGSVSMLFLKEFSYAQVSWLDVYINSGYIISVSGFLLIIGSMIYFHYKYKRSSITVPGTEEVILR